MKIAVKRLIRDEKGQTLIMALILLVIGGLIIAPLLAYMGTGLITGGVYERKAAELYAADAGVEDAVWKIQHRVPEVENLTQCNDSWSYNITDADDTVVEVNGKRVEVTITLMTIWDDIPFDYRIESRATGDRSGTEIEAYVIGASKYGDYSGILGQVITSCDELDLPTNPNVVIDPPVGEDNGPVGDYCDIGPWPEWEDLAEFYEEQVKTATHYYGVTEIDLKGNNCPPGPIYINGEAVDCPSGLGPLYIDVDGELDITSSISTKEATLTLNGTLYITGDTKIYGPTATEPYKLTLDLNEQTIFVDGALDIGRCTIEGPGAIIAVGDIYLAPGGDVGSNEEPVFVMSVEGTTIFQPSADFYGTIAGKLLVDIQPSAKVTITYPEVGGWYDDLNFLIGIQKLVYSIASWEVGPP